jgi:dipeptidyl aminopeptidase/acylaminoacyl peptidase
MAGTAVLCALAAACTALRPAAAATPLEVYGRLPMLENVVISTDGKKVAFVRPMRDERILTVVDLATGQKLFRSRVGSTKLRAMQWADEDSLLIEVSSTSLPPFGFTGPLQEWHQLLAVTVSKQKIAGIELASNSDKTLSAIVGAPMVRTIEGKTVIFVVGYYVADRVLPALFRYDPDRGRTHIVARASTPDTDWLVDADGQVAAESRYDDASKKWLISARRDGKLQAVAAGSSSLDEPELIGFDARGESLIVRFVENGHPLWRPWNLKEWSWGAPLGEGKTFFEPLADDRTGRIVGGSSGVDDDQYFFFDNELQAHWNAVLRTFPADERVDLLSSTEDRSRMIVRVFGPKDGYHYSLFDWYSHQMVSLAPVYEGLGNVAAVRKITYAAADGFSIPAYLTLPPGTPEGAHGLPLVVLPHGGPAASDSWNFDWWAQALADQGYVVLQPNYRGSTVNHEHLVAGFGEWGRKMQTDLSDGVHHLAGQGLVDPKRVCIVGASYGGYAALAGMTLQPGTYRCGVSVAGLSDLKAMMQWENANAGRSDSYVQRYWDRFMGVSGPDDPKLKEISPVEHVDAVSGPLLLIHGKDDTVVPYHQSELMEKALRKAGKSVEFVTLKHEDHWLSSSETRLQMLESTVAFLRTNNPP